MRGSASRYVNLSVLGEGTFAVVWKVCLQYSSLMTFERGNDSFIQDLFLNSLFARQARDVKTEEIVAIKSIKVTQSPEAANGLDHTALREIRFMQELEHDNICQVRYFLLMIAMVNAYSYKRFYSLSCDLFYIVVGCFWAW